MARPIPEDVPLVEPSAPIEGTYAAWSTLLWARDLGLLDITQLAVDNLGNVYIRFTAGTRGRIYDVNNVQTFNQLSYNWGYWTTNECRTWSALGRYQVGWSLNSGWPIDVFRDGALIFSRAPNLDVPNWTFNRLAAISPDGHYLAAVGQDGGTGRDQHLVLYEGA